MKNNILVFTPYYNTEDEDETLLGVQYNEFKTLNALIEKMTEYGDDELFYATHIQIEGCDRSCDIVTSRGFLGTIALVQGAAIFADMMCRTMSIHIYEYLSAEVMYSDVEIDMTNYANNMDTLKYYDGCYSCGEYVLKTEMHCPNCGAPTNPEQ